MRSDQDDRSGRGGCALGGGAAAGEAFGGGRAGGSAAMGAGWPAVAVAAAGLLAIGTIAAAELQLSIGVRETGANGGADVGIGNDGGAAGGIEWVNLDGQTLALDGTWQLFTFHITTDPLTAFAGATANSVLEGEYGVLEHIRIRNTGGHTEHLQIWVDDVRNTFDSAGGPPVAVNFGHFEGYADGTEVLFQEPSFSGSTQSNLTGASLAGVDNSVAQSGDASYRLGMQFVDDDPSRWVRLTTFGAENLPNPLIRLDQASVVTFWARGVIPGSGGMAMLMVAAMLQPRRRSRRW